MGSAAIARERETRHWTIAQRREALGEEWPSETFDERGKAYQRRGRVPRFLPTWLGGEADRVDGHGLRLPTEPSAAPWPEPVEMEADEFYGPWVALGPSRNEEDQMALFGSLVAAQMIVRAINALHEIAEKARWYAENDQRDPQEVDHALCVEVLALAEEALS